MHRFTFLSEEQVFGSEKLNILEIYGNQCEITDFSIMLGGGGTDFDVAVNSFTRRVENKIIFTDGCAPMPKKKIDVIWIVFGNQKINIKGGKVIYISNEQYRKLISK